MPNALGLHLHVEYRKILYNAECTRTRMHVLYTVQDSILPLRTIERRRTIKEKPFVRQLSCATTLVRPK